MRRRGEEDDPYLNGIPEFSLSEVSHPGGVPPGRGNLLFHGNNLDAIEFLLERGYGQKVDLVYLDPPFFSKANYSWKDNKGYPRVNVFSDFGEEDRSVYLSFLEERLRTMRELLSPTGSIYVHLDWHAVHYVREIMDRVFGPENFRNEIIWHYYLGGKSKRFFARKHDNILFYTRGPKWKFHPMKVKRRLNYVPGLPSRSSTGKKIDDSTGMDEAGWYSIVTADDVWEIPGVFNLSNEYTGFPTQKPMALMKRIIEASTEPGDLVADFFSGSGSTLLSAELSGRRWIGCDTSAIAVNTSLLRIYGSGKHKAFSVMKPDIRLSGRKLWDEYRRSVNECLGAGPLDENSFFSGRVSGSALYILEPGTLFDEGVLDRVVTELEGSGFRSAVVVGDFWALKRRGNKHCIACSENSRVQLVNVSSVEMVRNSGSKFMPILHFMEEISLERGGDSLVITDFRLRDTAKSGDSEPVLSGLESIRIWQTGEYSEKGAFLCNSDALTVANKGKNMKMPLENVNAGRIKSTSRILFGNSGRIQFVISD